MPAKFEDLVEAGLQALLGPRPALLRGIVTWAPRLKVCDSKEGVWVDSFSVCLFEKYILKNQNLTSFTT